MQRFSRRLFTIACWALCIVSFAASAHADISADQLESSIDQEVRLHLNGGDTRVVRVESYDDETLVVRDTDGTRDTLAIEDLDRLEVYQDGTQLLAEEDTTLRAENTHDAVIHDAIDRAERERALKREVRKAGRGLVITGSILLGAGLAFESVAIAAAVQAKRSDDAINSLFGASAAMGYAIVGAPFVLAGTGLLVGGLVKRGKARRHAKRELEYAVAPSFQRGGGGAQLHLSF